MRRRFRVAIPACFMAMTHAEAERVLAERTVPQTDLNGTMLLIEAMLVTNNPDAPAAEIDQRVAEIRRVFLGET